MFIFQSVAICVDCYFTSIHTIHVIHVQERNKIKLFSYKLKADRPHPRNYPPTPTDYRHTDKHLRLVMVLIGLYCTRQSRAPNIDRCAPENWPWPLILTHDLDLDLWPWPWCKVIVMSKHDFGIWPWPLTYDLDPQSQPSQGQGQPTYRISRSYVKRFSPERGRRRTDGRTDRRTDRRTDGRYQVHYLPRFAVNNYLLGLILKVHCLPGRGVHKP